MPEANQSQWQHVAPSDNLAKTIGNQAISSVAQPQPNKMTGGSSANQMPAGQRPLPGLPTPGFPSSTVSTTSAAVTQGLSTQSALPVGPPVFNATPLSTQTPGFGSGVLANAPPPFAFGGSHFTHTQQPHGTSLAAQSNAAQHSAGTQTLNFGAPVNAPPPFAFGGGQAAQNQQPHNTSLVALNNNASAPHPTQTHVPAVPINAPSFTFGGGQGTHIPPPQGTPFGAQANAAPAPAPPQTQASSNPASLLNQNGMSMASMKQSKGGNASAPAPTSSQIAAQQTAIKTIQYFLNLVNAMATRYRLRLLQGADEEELLGKGGLERKLVRLLRKVEPLEWQTGDNGKRLHAWLMSRPHEWIQHSKKYRGDVAVAEADIRNGSDDDEAAERGTR